MIYFGGNKEFDKIKLSGDLGTYYQWYKEKINSEYEWMDIDYNGAIYYLFQGLWRCSIKGEFEKEDWEKEVVDSFEQKYYSELNTYGISKESADEIINLDFDEREKKIEEIENRLTKEKATLEYSRKNPFSFENTSLTNSGDYIYYRGSIKNNSDLTYKFVEVRVTYYDSNMNIITADSTYAVGSEGIRPNESKEFEVMTKVRGEVSSGNIEIFDFSN